MTKSWVMGLPGSLSEVVLQQLSPQDHASLRQVSRAVCKHITQHLPYITLPLSGNSTTDHLQQWYQTTRVFSNVSSIHIYLAGEVSAELFDAAMHQLSLRSTPVTELHLLASVDDISSDTRITTCIASLQPLQHLLPHLHTLVIEDVAIKDLPADLHHLAAAAAAWPLQNLTLKAIWSDTTLPGASLGYCYWPSIITAVMDLRAVAPHMQQLNIKLPSLSFMDPHRCGQNSPGGPLSLDTLHDHNHQLVDGMHFAELGLVAAVANTVLQLKQLGTLTVTALPDIWEARGTSVVAAAAVATPEASAHVDAVLQQQAGPGLLRSVSSAAVAFSTLDDCGCWLLQQHPGLQQVHMGTTRVTTGCAMTWKRQQQEEHGCSSRMNASTGAAETALVVECDVTVDLNPQSGLAKHQTQHNSSSSGGATVLQAFTDKLSYYSCRPASIMHSISSCHLKLLYHDVACLDDLLGNMESLKHLEVHLMKEWSEQSTGCDIAAAEAAVAAAIKAAAAVPGLHSLTITTDDMRIPTTESLLLPLTAVAGGPGRSLKKLKLTGSFPTFVARAADDRCGSTGWYHALQFLDGLQHLSLVQRGPQQVQLPVDYLPASLEVLSCFMVDLVATSGLIGSRQSVIRTQVEHHDDHADVYIIDDEEQQAAFSGMPLPNLRSLALDFCHLSSPSMLACDQLEQLTVCGSGWSGGWAAAAEAWPNLRRLTCAYGECDEISSMISSNSDAQRFPEGDLVDQDFAQSMKIIFNSFAHAGSVTVHGVPWVTRQGRQHARQQLQQLRHVGIWHDEAGIVHIECSPAASHTSVGPQSTAHTGFTGRFLGISVLLGWVLSCIQRLVQLE